MKTGKIYAALIGLPLDARQMRSGRSRGPAALQQLL